MKQFEVGFTYRVEEYGTVELDAVDDTEADEFARDHVREAYPDATMIEIDYIKEVIVK